MQRRTFLKAAAAGGLIIGTGGYLWLRSAPGHDAFTVDGSLRQLDALADRPLSSAGDWDPAEIFDHCAQSVEYSMTGYPEHKSAVFQKTAGRLAFGVFAAKGAMSHSLSEPIPGAPSLDPNSDVQDGLHRLRTALIAFRDYPGQLQPHFAYGQLSKDEYTIAHAIHLNNHLTQITT